MKKLKKLMQRAIILCINEILEAMKDVRNTKDTSMMAAFTGSSIPGQLQTLTSCAMKLTASFLMLSNRDARKWMIKTVTTLENDVQRVETEDDESEPPEVPE